MTKFQSLGLATGKERNSQVWLNALLWNQSHGRALPLASEKEKKGKEKLF